MSTSQSKRKTKTRSARANGIAPQREKHSAGGLQIITGLDGFIAALEAGGVAELEKRFTVHKVRRPVFAMPPLGKDDVLAIRTALGASQPVFASLLGVSPATVRAWEQGVNTPSGIARRFLAEVRADPDYWKARLKEAAGA